MSTTPEPVPSRLDPEPVPRRDFLGIASLCSTAAALLFAGIGMLRLPKAAVLSSPSKRFRVTLPESLAEGEAYIPPGRSIALFRDEEGVFAISLVCTHLGCIVSSIPDGFECACHGSRFDPDGGVMKGPAPTALPWHRVTKSEDEFIVDEEEIVPMGTRVSL